MMFLYEKIDWMPRSFAQVKRPGWSSFGTGLLVRGMTAQGEYREERVKRWSSSSESRICFTSAFAMYVAQEEPDVKYHFPARMRQPV